LKTKKILIYGAYGYTGRLIVERCAKKGYQKNIIIGGRNKEKTLDLAKKFGFEETKVFDSSTANLEKELDGIDLLVNCAGPFVETCVPFVEACLKKKCHYTDITGEIDVFETLSKYDQKAKDAGIIVFPGTGMDVVPSDCLIKKLHEKLPDAKSIELGFISSKGGISRGTLKTALGGFFGGTGTSVRENTKIITKAPEFETLEIIEGKKTTVCTVSWGDVSTGFHSTKVPNIKVFIPMPKYFMLLYYYVLSYFFLIFRFVGWAIIALVDKCYDGPDLESTKDARVYFYGRAINEKGEKVEGRLNIHEGYRFTADSTILIFEKILTQEKNSESGYKTPSLLFGSGLIDEIEGVKISNIK